MINKKNFSKRLILCDFDGTVTIQDVTDEILHRHAADGWRDIGKLYSEGNITHEEMNQQFAKLVKVLPTKLKKFLERNIEVRDSFYKFVDLSNKFDIPLVVISSGWNFYIRHILKEKSLNFVKSLDELCTKVTAEQTALVTIANEIVFNKKQDKWRMKSLWNESSCKISSPCKGYVVRFLRHCGVEEIIAIGNSSTDICMVKEADIVFSTGELTKLCSKNNMRSRHFDSFDQISNDLFLSKETTSAHMS